MHVKIKKYAVIFLNKILFFRAYTYQNVGLRRKCKFYRTIVKNVNTVNAYLRSGEGNFSKCYKISILEKPIKSIKQILNVLTLFFYFQNYQN